MEQSKPDTIVQPETTAPPVQTRGHTARHGSARGLAAVSEAVRIFLTSEFQARELRVTRLAALAGPDAGWEAEAEILVPDLAIKTLGLPLTQEVLERRRYAVQLDRSLAVMGYEPIDHDG
jgi:hypothetical protein